MIPQLLRPGGAYAPLARTWSITPTLAARLLVVASMLPFPVSIISGFRTRSEQAALNAAGRPAADDQLSTHRTNPATGADVQLSTWRTSTAPLEARKAFGRAVRAAGLRWGGGSKPDPRTGLPSDWNHVDLGARR